MYYKVEAKCGHVGKNNYVVKAFAIEAENGRAAAAIARNMPRVKHNHKDAIRNVEAVDINEYKKINAVNDLDPYFFCKNIQQQRALCELDVIEEKSVNLWRKHETNTKVTYLGKEKIRNPKKYMNNYYIGDDDIA